MENNYAAQGFDVLGFYSNDFGNQGGDPTACTDMYHITYDQFAIDHVTPPSAQPVFAWIESQPNPGPEASLIPTWNFNKYLIARDGTLVGHWEAELWPGDDPNDPNDSYDTNPIVVAIEAQIAQPTP